MDKLSKKGSKIAELIEKGREQGYLTYADVNDHLPEDISDPDQVDEIIGMINDLGLQVHETAPDADTLMLAESEDSDDIALEHRHKLRWNIVEGALCQFRCQCSSAPLSVFPRKIVGEPGMAGLVQKCRRCSSAGHRCSSARKPPFSRNLPITFRVLWLANGFVDHL